MEAILTDQIIVHCSELHQKTVFHIMDKDGKGYARLSRQVGETVGEIEELDVSLDERGKGIGTMLLSYIITIAKGIELESLWASARTSLQFKFYKKNGFENLFPNQERFTSLKFDLTK